MAIIEQLVALIGHLVWPMVVLFIALRFSLPINNLLSNLSAHLVSSKNLRWKMGGMEIESSAIEINKDELEEIVKEESLERRLELFNKRFDIENTLKQLESSDLEWLQRFSDSYNIPSAFIICPYDGREGKNEIDAFDKLEKLGLVKYMHYTFQGGELIGSVTEKGHEMIKTLRQDKESLEKHQNH